jgi:hypothetical protein
LRRSPDAIAAERQIKGWRREKKDALIRGDLDACHGARTAIMLHWHPAPFDKLRVRMDVVGHLLAG